MTIGQPLQRALRAAGVWGFERSYFYFDYLYDHQRDGCTPAPMSEPQWEDLVRLLAHRKLESGQLLDDAIRVIALEHPPADVDEQDAANIVDTHLPAIAENFAKQGLLQAASTIRRARALMVEMMENARLLAEAPPHG